MENHQIFLTLGLFLIISTCASLPLRKVRDIYPDVGSFTMEPTTEAKEILKPATEDVTALVQNIHRTKRAPRDRSYDDYYDNDKDYAGYDRKGAEVGYMDKNDDFPTVVW